MLPQLGYEVVSAASGEEALATYRQRDAAIRAVVLDASMPGIGGARTLDGLRALAPRLPILLCSGFPEESARARCQIDGHAGFLQKPFDLGELDRALQDLLGLIPTPRQSLRPFTCRSNQSNISARQWRMLARAS